MELRLSDLASERPPPSTPPRVLLGNLVAASCGGRVLASSASVAPIGGVQSVLSPGNSACLEGAPGQDLIVDVAVCPAAAEGLTTFTVAHSTRRADERSGGAFSRIEVWGKDAGEYQLIGERRSFGNVQVRTAGDPLKGVTALRFKLHGVDAFIQRLCGLEVR